MKRKALLAHISELEELVENLLADARTGSTQAREQAVALHQEVMQKRQRLRGLRGEG